MHCQWASSSSHLQFLSDCYTLKTHEHSPSQRWESHTQQQSVKSWKTWLLSSTTAGTQNLAEQCASTKLYQRQNIHATWARTTSRSGTYLCCLHHMVRVVVFHWWQFSHVSAALIDAQRELSGLFARPCNTTLQVL